MRGRQGRVPEGYARGAEGWPQPRQHTPAPPGPACARLQGGCTGNS